MAIGFGVPSSINGSNVMLGCESLHLSDVHLIEDRALRFCHVAHEEELSCYAYHLSCFTYIGRSGYVHLSTGVCWLLSILAIITPQING